MKTLGVVLAPPGDMDNRCVLVRLLPFVFVGACGGSTASDTTAVSEDEITTYRQLAAQLQSAATSYETEMNGATAASCRAVHDRYDGKVRGWMSQMGPMAGRMDDFMRVHGGMMDADGRCVLGAMMSDLDHHRSVACTSADFSRDQAEAARHAGVMRSYAHQMIARCDEMMRGAPWAWQPMMGACASSPLDGGMPHGGMDGGMMP